MVRNVFKIKVLKKRRKPKKVFKQQIDFGLHKGLNERHGSKEQS